MVSLEQRQALSSLVESDFHLKRFSAFLNGDPETSPSLKIINEGVRENLLSSIASSSASQFRNEAENISKRKISSESDWCHDDYLIFLLLLGKEKFGCPLSFLREVIEVRRQNPNPIPRKINDVFAALERREFGMDGEFCFLKIPFLYLAGKLHLTPPEAQKAMLAMAQVGLLDQMPPFFKLLTQKAHDLVLFERKPSVIETTTQLIEGFETHAKNLSLRQWWRVIAALPGRIIWASIMLVTSAGFIPFLFGVGKEIAGSREHQEIRHRPEILSIASIKESIADLPFEAQLLVKSISPTNENERKFSTFIIETEPFNHPTTAFSVEVSHRSNSIKNAFAFTRGSNPELQDFTIVPVQRDSSRFRALLPPQPAKQRLHFVVIIESRTNETAADEAKNFVVRPLQ